MTGGRPVVRAHTVDDARASWDLGVESFGHAEPAPDPLPDPTRRGRVMLGAFVDDTLVGRVGALSLSSWWGGREVPTAGIASVAVRLEERGSGSLGLLMPALHDRARERGDVLATLYATAQGIYRRFGYETVTSFDQVELPTRLLLDVPVDEPADAQDGTREVRLRRGTADDLDAMQAAYTRWAREHDGPLTRSGPQFPPDVTAFLQALDGAHVTLVEEDGAVTGYATWRRTDGYHQGVTAVDDLVVTTPSAARALLHQLGTSHAVAPTTTLWTSGADPLRLHLPGNAWRPVDQRPYALAVLDVPAAFEARGYPGHLDADLTFAVSPGHGGDPVAGTYRLRVTAGRATCERLADDPAPGIRLLHPRALSLAYAGAQPSSAQRQAGLLTGPADDDAVWDTLTGGRQVRVRDYF